MNNQTKTLLLVLGMHRSGTSAVTRGLMALGVDLGNQLMKSNDSDYILPLNIVRNDVVAFLKNKEIETHQLCGFEYKINSVDEIQLCIENEIGEKTVLARLYKSAKSFSKTQKSFEKDTYPFFSVKNLSVFTQTKSLSELLLTHERKVH